MENLVPTFDKDNLKILKAKITSLVKKMTKDVKSEGEKYGIPVHVIVKIELDQKEIKDGGI